MSGEDFDLQAEYGGFLDLIGKYIPEIDDGSVQHYGVKGMHWGVRKERPASGREPLKSLGPDSVSTKTASGETITLQKVKPNGMVKFLGRVSKKYRVGYSKQASLNILDGAGKKVGEAHVMKKSNEELYLNWLGINKSARGKGYATAVMKAGRDFGKQQGFKRMTLEVPGNSPDARHIYEKLGFQVVKEGNPKDDPIWGGLTDMVYEFDAKHADGLVHYGVKGMHWGVRKNTPTNSNYSVGQRQYDKKQYGHRAVKRINRRMNAGASLEVARKQERSRRTKVRTVATLAVLFAPELAVGAHHASNVIKMSGGVLSQKVAMKAETNRGRAHAAATMGLPSKPTTGPTFAKKNRKGVHNITSL